ncbi:MAG: transposase [Nitrososphaeria archaeon]
MERLKDWEVFRPILNSLFKDRPVERQHVHIVVMAKILDLQAWYSLSDELLEFRCKEMLTFQNFLNCPESFPDARTV